MKKRGKSLLALLLAIVMILSSASISYAAPDEASQPGSEESAADEVSQTDPEESAEDEVSQPDSEESAEDESNELKMEDLDPSTLGIKKLGEEDEGEDGGEISPTPDTSLNETVRVSIFLKTPATLDAGYSANGVGTNAGAISYRNALKANQAQMTAAIESAIGYSLNVKWNLTLLVNAISGYVKVKDIPAIERLDGVAAVQRETRYTVPVEGSGNNPNTTHTSSGMVGAADAWSAGYTGAGMRIAIIDTGIDTEHQSFSADAFNYSINQQGKTSALMTSSDISAVASQLNGAGTYVSSKIPYGYNYVDGNTTINHLSDSEGEHGSHVAGIAAANRYIMSGSTYVDATTSVYAVGMAPDAQLLVMKVFGAGGGAYDSDYMAAIEDAVVLGCDACNLSLGSGAQGFTYSSTYYQNILNNLSSQDSNYGMVVSISAGNSSALTANLYTDLFIDDVSLHTGGSPGTYINSLCVAAAENIGLTGTPLVYNGKNIYYTESSSSGGRMVNVSGACDFVYIDAMGEAEDYETVNSELSLSGKLVIVNRGEINFTDKGNNLISYSPKALVVANNQPGTISMQLDAYTGTFPMVSITLADANMIKQGAAKTTIGNYTCYTGTINISAATTSDVYVTRDDVSICDFSSWGVPGSLLMKPEITAPGGNIYSVAGTNLTNKGTIAGGKDQYELMSGTSMAAPHMAGLSAVVAQYLKDQKITIPGYSRRALIQSLLMSTATPMKNGGSYVSILQQGAGLADVSKAVSAGSAIFMTNADLTSKTGAAADGKVKVELGDDPSKSGAYSYSFRIYNLTNDTLKFDAPTTNIFTQGYYEYYGYHFMDEATVAAGSQTGYSWIPNVVYSNPYDVNKDSTTTDQDAQAILDYLAGNKSANELNLDVADLDNDSSVTSYDAHLILEYLENEQEAAVGCYVPANGYADVTISFSFAVDNNIYTSGAYIEGFTYVTEKTRKDGVEGVQHTIPILGFYGSWTDPSMFDNTSYVDLLYGTDEYPYSGNALTNYLTIYYNGVSTKFSGNPYYIEDEFPTERLAVNSTNKFGNIYYNLYRAAGTTGFAVSKLDKIGGNVSDVLTVKTVGADVTGIWFDQQNGVWQNTGTKFYTVRKSSSDYDLEEGDVVRVGFYAIPEYNGMLINGNMTDAYAGALEDDGFEALIKSGVLADGAFIGYDFTIDDTYPEIISAVLNGSDLTVKATDNQNIAYIAITSLDGDIIYEDAAPAIDEYSITFDASEAIETAEGYVAVFVADYAGNEVAKAVKVNDNVTFEETIYVLTDTVTAEDNYLIVNANSEGIGYALSHDGTAVKADEVVINEEISDADDEITVYIKSADVADASIWNVGEGNTFQNGDYYLSYSGSGTPSLNCAATPTTWTVGANTLYNRTNRNYYVGCVNGAWSMSRTTNNVFFYKEAKRSQTIDPLAVTSVAVSPAKLDIYKGNTAELVVEVLPLTAEDRTVNWTSSDPSVATVDDDGIVTAVAAGTATITATSNSDDNMCASCEVMVTSVNKTFHSIIWDEIGGVYFSNFNASSLPAWSRNHSDAKKLQLASAFMQNASTLYAATLDTSAATTDLYTVDRSSYELTPYGENYVWATDIAIGANDQYGLDEYIGMVYTFRSYLLAGPVVPDDPDPEDDIEEAYCGLPYALDEFSETTGGAWFAGIACESRSYQGGTYFVLDENGVIWETTLALNAAQTGFEFSNLTEVLDTGISTSFLYQNLYYDGTYLYWSHYSEEDNTSTLYIINPDKGVIYDAGNFGEGVWPATGIYVDGSAAPASTGDAAMSAPANLNLSGLKIQVTRDQLMTADVQARFAAEAARFATKVVTPAEEPEEEPTEPEDEDPEEEPEEPTESAEEEPEEPTEPAEGEPEEPTEPAEGEPEEPTEPAEGEPEEPTEPAEGEPEEPTEPIEEAPVDDVTEPAPEENGDAGEPEPEGEEIADPDPEYTGSANAVGNVTEVNKPVRNKAAVKEDDPQAADDAVQIRLYEEVDSHNGLYTVSYDPAKLTYVDTESDAAYQSVHADTENGTVTFAFATNKAASFTADADIAVVNFTLKTDGTTTVTVTTKERDYELGLTEEDELKIGESEVISASFNHSCSLGNNLAVNYYVPADSVEGYENIRLIINKQTFNEDGSSVTWKEFTLNDYTLYTNNGKKYLRFVFNNITAKEMGDELRATVEAEKDGTNYTSLEDVYSIKQYAYNRLEKSSDELFKTLLVDMLNYGAAAQEYFKYNTGNPVNADLTEAQRALATAEVPELEGAPADVVTTGATAKFKGKNIVMGSNVEMKFAMTFDSGNPADSVTLVLSYTAINGTKYDKTIPASEFVYDSSISAYTAKLTTIAAKDMSSIVTAKIYDGDQLISNEIHYSIETYVRNRLNASTNELFKALIGEMIKYGKSAEAYFKNKN